MADCRARNSGGWTGSWLGSASWGVRFKTAAAIPRVRPFSAAGLFASLAVLTAVANAVAESQKPWARDIAALIEAYPDFLDRVDGGELVWKDGTRMIIDDGIKEKPFDAWLDAPDIKDQFRVSYPLGRAGLPPAPDSDPGRARHTPLFQKMYGACAAGKEPPSLVNIAWLPSHGGQKLKVTSINGVAAKLAAVSGELDKLAPEFLKYLKPSAGTYVCRPIAGTSRTSAHGFGVAIDINADQSDYWRWSKPGSDGAYPYKNRIPWEIVEIFEKHGFIWGGKWRHYDTMHFEYRPELIAAAKARIDKTSP